MTTQMPHQRILASAGSGKTYQLVTRYLAIVDRIERPDGILASTFTRAAAGEIRERILMRLAEAVEDASKRVELAGQLARPRLTRDDALRRLTQLSRSIHRMNIRTLDSFFASVVRAFALELRVPPGAQVMDEVQTVAVRTEAIRRVLDEADGDDLVELLRLITQGQSERSVHRTLDSEVATLYEVFRESLPEAWETLRERPGRLDPPALVQAIQSLEAFEPAGRGFGKTHAADCARARVWDWDAFIEKGVSAKIARDEEMYGRQRIPDDMAAAYKPVVDHAVAELIHRARAQTLATRDLLTRFDQHHSDVKRERNAIAFSDLTFILNRAQHDPMFDSGYTELCYRLDAQIDHMLLDEFQDTSVPQWRVLEPIARELVSDETTGRSFFCVGDVKQSIYGWRSAAPEILEQLPTLLFGEGGESAMIDAPLAKSWRSSPIVIETVNRVFTTLTMNPALDDAREAADAWAAGFAVHSTARADLPGRVELHLLDVGHGKKQEKDLSRFKQAAAFIADLHHRARGRSIGVLTRTNAAVQRLMYALGPTGFGLPVGGRGGGPLTDSPLVGAVLDLLQLAEHPDDTAAAYHIAHSPLGTVVGLSDHRAVGRRRALAHEVRDRIQREGFAGTIARWLSRVADAASAYELRRALQLVELAEQWDASGEWRARGLIDLVEAQSVGDARPAPIQLMTVHQSKGLEFDLVVLPELESNLCSQKSSVVFTRNGVAGPIDRISRWMKSSLRALVPEVQPLYESHAAGIARESLCVLYVAMTRARQGLYMLINAPGLTAKGAPSTAGRKAMSGLLRHALAEGATEPGLAFAAGTDDWLDDATPAERDEAPTISAEAIQLASREGRVDRLRRDEPPSTHEEERLRSRLQPRDEHALLRGTAIHLLFEQIEWLETFTADDESLIQLLQGRLPATDVTWCTARVNEFRRAIASPQISAILRVGDRDASRLTVERELPFVRRTAEGIQSGVIDRIVITRSREDGPAESVEVIDYKTDRVGHVESGVMGAVDRYQPQLRAYAEAIAPRFGVAAESVRTRLVLVETGEVIPAM